MKRFHVHVSVPDLPASIGFYSRLFGMEPSVRKPDYAKWMLDDPRVNFAISTWGSTRGINHLGLQADTADELAELGARFAAADAATAAPEPNAHCCYAVSDKHWVEDPQGIAWEAFHTLDSVPLFERGDVAAATSSGCCGEVRPASGATAQEPTTLQAVRVAAPSTSGRCCG